MKNVFKFLGVAFVACTMLVACGDLTVTATANDDSMGTVTGGGMFEEGASCTLTATPNAGYIFVKWSDGVTDNPRTFTVTEDVSLVAEFAVENGTSVGFKAQSWKAQGGGSFYYPVQGIVGVHALSTNASSYPIADAFYHAAATGTLTDAVDESTGDYGDVISYVEYYEDSYLTDNNNQTYGDWWAKSATINVKGFDATTLNLYFTLDAVMFNAEEAIVDGQLSGIATAPTANMTMISNTTMTAQTATKGDAPVCIKHWNK